MVLHTNIISKKEIGLRNVHFFTVPPFSFSCYTSNVEHVSANHYVPIIYGYSMHI